MTVLSKPQPPVKEALDLVREFPERLKRLRSLLGFTQEQLGDVLGIGQPCICRWEAGQSRPDDVALFAVVILWLEVTEAQARTEADLKKRLYKDKH
jgi:transcriptional regulator with XRE-family HTH domain